MSSKDSSSGKAKASEGTSQAQEQESSPSQTPVGSSTPTAAETRHPLHRSESITEESEDVLGSSVRSTDTVRRRPEPSATGYGMLRYPHEPPVLSQSGNKRCKKGGRLTQDY